MAFSTARGRPQKTTGGIGLLPSPVSQRGGGPRSPRVIAPELGAGQLHPNLALKKK